MKYNVAIVGATGAVGRKMLETLYLRKFPFQKITLLASKKSEGNIISFEGNNHEVKALENFDFQDTNIAFFSAGSKVSEIYAPIAEDRKCYVIDNTSYFRMVEDIPLVVPEINAKELIKTNRKIIANPNCSTIQMVVALAPIHNFCKIKRIVISTYQSVSGAGQSAISELKEQSKNILENKNVIIENFPKQIAFNVVPQIDDFLDNGFTKEEIKMVNETKKILDKDIKVNATCVRVSTEVGHAESIYFELEKKLELDEIKRILKNTKEIIFSDTDYHTPIDCSGNDWVYVSRLRKDLFNENGFNFWVVSDNLLKGAALNSVQIAESLIKQGVL
ncbi:MAG: Aspartate-semialdehyde dehydrogenase 2 [Alphaproteobacteria bacterium MarineAlpha9_Bin4]|nr:aspartate-semialdehyde dehydrogenase [Pelagibacterales bacterium]PPR27057.1 MAG: Aspartate-semialdehyde dehydrogenase 2 [Alphaproteobacteria bacterium MarineAlpha9_Bin4]|tara:strand:+ start:1398 stop:2396 length:999 start_codon:yes stop_codon:yes gene_type:complete